MSKNYKFFYQTLAMSNDINFGGGSVLSAMPIFVTLGSIKNWLMPMEKATVVH